MTRWPKNRMWYRGLFIIAVLLLLAGCTGGGDDSCGGIDDIISCVRVTNVEPANAEVDIADCNADGVPDPPGESEFATFTFRNDAFPSFQEGVEPENLEVEIRSVTVSYDAQPQCGQGQVVCPQLDDHSEAVTIFLEDNGGTSSKDVTLVSAFTKGQYAVQILDPNVPGLYTANLVFQANTVGFEDNFEIRSSVPFSIGNFGCP